MNRRLLVGTKSNQVVQSIIESERFDDIREYVRKSFLGKRFDYIKIKLANRLYAIAKRIAVWAATSKYRLIIKNVGAQLDKDTNNQLIESNLFGLKTRNEVLRMAGGDTAFYINRTRGREERVRRAVSFYESLGIKED